MLEDILLYERNAFFLINGSDYLFLDNIMWIVSGKTVWLPLAALILFILVWKKPWRESLLILLSIVLLITLCDQFTSHLCKPLFARFRPTHHPDFMNQVKIVFEYRGGLYGFMSSHAANAFGFAVFISLLFRYRWFTVTILFWAALMAYTRIYLGVHFISDVFFGALSGIIFGYGVYWLYQWTRKKLFNGVGDSPSDLYSRKQKNIIIAGILFTISTIVVLNTILISFLH